MERWSIFNIFLHAAFALTHSRILPPLCLSNGQWGQTGELEVEKGGRASHLCCRKLDNNSGRGRIYFAFCFRDQMERSLGREQLFCYPILTLIITIDMSSNWLIPDDNQIFCLWVVWSHDVSTNIPPKNQQPEPQTQNHNKSSLLRTRWRPRH